MSYRSFAPRHPESVVTLLLLWVTLAVPASWAGQGYLVRYDNNTHREITMYYIGVDGGGINCWYQKHLPDVKKVEPQDHTGWYITEANASGGCYFAPFDHLKFALLAETAEGRQRALRVFNTDDQTGDPRKDCSFYGFCPLIQDDSHFGRSELFLTAGGDLSDDSNRWAHQGMQVDRAGQVIEDPIKIVYKVASELTLDAENLTGSSRNAETVYKVRVTAPVFSFPGIFNNRLLEAFAVQGSNDQDTWDDLGLLLPSDDGLLEAGSLSSQYGSGDAVFYYQPSADLSYRYLQVSQCTAARDYSTDEPTCSSATVDLEGLSPPFSTGTPPDISQITIALEPTTSQGGSEASVTANGLAQEAILVTLYDGDGSPIHPDNPTLGGLYDLLYFLDPTSDTLITNFHSKSGFSSMSDLQGPYTAVLGAGESDEQDHGKFGVQTRAANKNVRVIPPSTYYFTTTLAQENSIAVRLRIDDQVVCPSQKVFEGGGCQANIIGAAPDLALVEHSTSHLSFNNALIAPSETAALTYVAYLDQDQPVVGLISEYEVLYYCPDDDDNDLHNIGVTSASVTSSDAKTLELDHHHHSCKTFATTIIDVYGSSLAPRADPASYSSAVDFGATGSWGATQ